MKRRDIPKPEWPSFFDHFSRLHHGQDADVEIVDRSANVQSPARALPLLGVTEERHSDQAEQVAIIAGKPEGPLVTHVVNGPRHVRAAEWNDEVSAALEIESDDGLTTLVRVGPPEQTLPAGMITDGLYQRGD